ncbi:hypothetical protein PVAND_003940 [Polypedilum vanderplanki]|uniref:Chromo domain-containing protein n=1 Tax=Polypedilum vanderplanki TaxID=319348 RepID=A0A9J6BVM4_POLVA|nr:hypothetical protein PVAND_003940 [Polypedilum vanderplanki]
MSDSEESFESAKDKDFQEDEGEEESSDDEPLAKKSKKSPKASSKKSKSPKKAKKAKKDKKKSKNKKEKKGRVSFNLVPNETAEKVEEEYEVENIVGHREYNGKLMYKIRWKNYEPIHDTWESYASLSCPDILESYNLKHNVTVPKTAMSKRKGKAGKKSNNGRKRTNSVSSSDEEEDVPYDEGSDAEYEVERIVEMRMKKDGSREFLVHWKRWSSDYDTWEPEDNLNCPDLIEKFMVKLENAKNSNVKELRENRKRTERFTLNTRDSGRRLSKRNNQKQRVQYFDNEASDAED